LRERYLPIKGKLKASQINTHQHSSTTAKTFLRTRRDVSWHGMSCCRAAQVEALSADLSILHQVVS